MHLHTLYSPSGDEKTARNTFKEESLTRSYINPGK